MGVTLAAGGSLGWWRELLHDLDAELDYDRLTALAEAAPPGSEGLVFLPYLTGERTPHLDPFARGAFFGLTARHRIPHLTRAVMEGVVCSLRECLELIREAGAPIEQIRATGGGARSGFWRRLQAEVYGCPIHLPEAEEGPAYGAALLGGVAARVFDSVADACQTVRLRPDVDVPDPERAAVYERQFAVYRSLYAATRDAMHALHDAGSARVR
jgi:xylulokinase